MGSKSRKKSIDTNVQSATDSKKLSQKHKNYIYTGVFFTIVMFLFIVNNYNGEPEEGPYPPNYMESLQSTLNLADYRGKVVALSFWTTQDKFTEQTLYDLVYVKDHYKKDNFEIIGVSLDEVRQTGITREDLISYLNQFNLNFPVVIGSNKMMSDYGGIPKLPALFIIDQYGNILSHHQGRVNTVPLVVDIKLAMESTGEDETLVAPDFTLQKLTSGY